MVLIYSRQMKKLKKEWIGYFHGLILFSCFNYQFTAAVDGTSNFLLAVLNFVNRGHKRDIKEEQASGFRGLAPFCLSCLIGGVLVALGMSSGALPQLHVRKAHTCAVFVVHTSRPLLCDSQQQCCLLCSWYLPSPS